LTHDQQCSNISLMMDIFVRQAMQQYP